MVCPHSVTVDSVAMRPVAGYIRSDKGANHCGSSVTVYETGPSNVCPLLPVMSSDARLRRHQREAWKGLRN